jgi:hypothetical protein
MRSRGFFPTTARPARGLMDTITADIGKHPGDPDGQAWRSEEPCCGRMFYASQRRSGLVGPLGCVLHPYFPGGR